MACRISFGFLLSIALVPEVILAKRVSVNSSQYYNYSTEGHGCPAGFTLIAGICLRVYKTPLLSYHNASKVAPTDPYGSRLAKIRDKETWQYLASQMTKLGIGNMYLGLRDVSDGKDISHDWRWEDGTIVPIPDTTGVLKWEVREPNYQEETRLAIAEPDYCWGDRFQKLGFETVAQAPAIKGICPPQYSLFETTCYSLEEKNGTAAILTTADQWKFVVEMIKKSSKKVKSFYIGGERVKGKWPFDDFQQWCNGEPDNKKESYGVMSDQGLNDVHGSWKHPFAKEWMASSCSEWYHLGRKTNGEYLVLPRGAKVETKVQCDMETNGGGWTVIQSRQGQTNFSKSLKEYTEGFAVGNDSWLGLKAISLLTSQEESSLLIEFTDTKGSKYALEYFKFHLRKEESSFKFSVESVKIYTAVGLSDELGKQQNVAFSVDPRRGGWWFAPDCSANLNGNHPSGQPAVSGDALMQWSPKFVITKATMKVKSSYFSKRQQLTSCL